MVSCLDTIDGESGDRCSIKVVEGIRVHIPDTFWIREVQLAILLQPDDVKRSDEPISSNEERDKGC